MNQSLHFVLQIHKISKAKIKEISLVMQTGLQAVSENAQSIGIVA
jgi:hypothetical protein